MKIEENISLKEHTTFKIGGKARYFCLVQNEKDLKEAVAFAKREKVPTLVLGGGSNVLISEKGFDGLVVKIELKGIEFEEARGGVLVHVGAGENWDSFVAETVRRGLFGLENLSGIPGTVGGAPVQNIGAYGAEVKDVFDSVEVFDPLTGGIFAMTKKECEFAYRDSIFKHEEGKHLIILRVTFFLKENGELNTSYKDVKKYLEEKKITEPTQEEVRNAVIEIRSKKFPDLKKFGTAGSFFKNPIIQREEFEKLLNDYPKLPSFPAGEGLVKIPAGYLFDVICGFKGVRHGDAGVFENQALVLVNWGKATAEEIKKLAEEMRAKVKEKTGIEIEFEVNIL
ncbi:MAG: UDP-N-acetylmuramate dehydrogenase [Candidatus Pacebacteria bacterium]|nr:UDP-N-acetylmuramate dehydrogenase [Candidatus Paceibacterota bacterium]